MRTSDLQALKIGQFSQDNIHCLVVISAAELLFVPGVTYNTRLKQNEFQEQFQYLACSKRDKLDDA
eukprot:scaffold57745_cov38-Prasinocladus_malaysianus.AAC.1